MQSSLNNLRNFSQVYKKYINLYDAKSMHY